MRIAEKKETGRGGGPQHGRVRTLAGGACVQSRTHNCIHAKDTSKEILEPARMCHFQKRKKLWCWRSIAQTSPGARSRVSLCTSSPSFRRCHRERTGRIAAHSSFLNHFTNFKTVIAVLCQQTWLCLDLFSLNFERASFYIWSIKYRLIIELIIELVCKLRDESNESN